MEKRTADITIATEEGIVGCFLSELWELSGCDRPTRITQPAPGSIMLSWDLASLAEARECLYHVSAWWGYESALCGEEAFEVYESQDW